MYLAIVLTLQGVNNTNYTDSYRDSATPWLDFIICLISDKTDLVTWGRGVS